MMHADPMLGVMLTAVLLEMPSTSVPLSIAAGYVGLLTMARCISSVTVSAQAGHVSIIAASSLQQHRAQY